MRGWNSLDQVSSAVRSGLSRIKDQDRPVCNARGAGKLVFNPRLEIESYVFTSVHKYSVCK